MTAPVLTGIDAFELGDCRDCAAGTLLRGAGVTHPEDLLFAPLHFGVREMADEFRNVEVSHRGADPLDRLAEAFGTTLVEWTVAGAG